MEEWKIGKKRSKLYRVPVNFMKKRWSIRGLNENSVEEMLQSQITWKFHFFLKFSEANRHDLKLLKGIILNNLKLLR